MTRTLRLRRRLRWAAAVSAAGAIAVLAAPSAVAGSGTGVRVAGTDRFATAVALSQEAFGTGSDVVVIVDGLAFPDALAAALAAGALGAPILPVRPDGVPDAVRAEVARLHASTALVVGGTAAVGPSVVAALQGMGLTVARASGADRYATSAQVATRVVATGTPTEVVVASGSLFADGLVGGAYGAATGSPLLLTARDALPAATASALATLHPSSITVLGGTAAVSDAVLAQLRTSTSGTVRRVAGADRYATAAALQRTLWTSAPTAVVASGASFPDALAAGALGAPIVLARQGCLPAAAADALAGWRTTTTVVVGGTKALGEASATGTRCA